MMVVGLVMAVYRRSAMRPERLNTLIEDRWILSLISLLVISGFMVEGLRIAATSPETPWAEPIGNLFAIVYSGIGMSINGMEITHFALYWVHVGIWSGILVYGAVRFSKLSHMFLAPANALLRSDRPLGALRPMGDMETLLDEGSALGARDLSDFTWKQLIDFDSCTNCGSSQDQCRAWARCRVADCGNRGLEAGSTFRYHGPALDEPVTQHAKSHPGNALSRHRFVGDGDVCWAWH